MTLTRPKPRDFRRDRPADPAAVRPPRPEAAPGGAAVKNTLARWVAAHPGPGLAAGAAAGAVLGWLLKRR